MMTTKVRKETVWDDANNEFVEMDVVTCDTNTQGQFMAVYVKSGKLGLMFNFMLFAIIVILKDLLN